MPKHISSCENVCVKNFCANNNFLWADVHSNNVSYTYHNDKLQCFSLIDHILCSPELVRTQDCVEILLHGDNLSDHVHALSVFYHHLHQNILPCHLAHLI